MADHIPEVSPPPGELEAAREKLEQVLAWAAPEWWIGPYLRTLLAALSTTQAERDAAIARAEAAEEEIRGERELHAGTLDELWLAQTLLAATRQRAEAAEALSRHPVSNAGHTAALGGKQGFGQ